MKLLNGPSTPRLLRTIKMIARPLDYLDDYAQRYGDPFRVGGEKSPGAVYFSHPQALQEIFTADPELFAANRGNGFIQLLLGGNSLILLDGKRHLHQRRLLTPPFHGDRIRSYSQLICDITKQVTTQWKIDEPFVVRSSMQGITLRVILQAVFGLHQGPRFEQLRQLLSSLLDSITSPLSSSLLFFPSLQKDWGSLSPWGRFLRQKQQIDQLLYEEIRERREKGDLSGSDILTLLMSARVSESVAGKDSTQAPPNASREAVASKEAGHGSVLEPGQLMTDEELRDELMTLLIAGHETTTSALTWALYWIHHLPEVHDKLLHELNSLGDDAHPSEIAKLPYLTAVCQETLRIYPILTEAFVRILKSPFQLMGYELEAGTALIPCIYLTHHREDLYSEPKRFKPERFLERQFSQYEYLPFGGGHRRCIGMAFAQFTMKLALATIVSRYQLALVDQRKVLPVRRGFTLAPPRGMRMVVTSQRQNPLGRLYS